MTNHPQRWRARTAIIAAMSQELDALLDGVVHDHVEQHAGRRFHFSRLHGEPVVMVLCGIGKVAAAATTVLLAERYGVQRIVFTGVAGGLHADVRVGDVVMATELLQHDMDARPLFPRHEVPLSGKSRFAADPVLSAALADAARALLADLPGQLGAEAVGLIGRHEPRLHQGLIVSGDVFIGSAQASQALRDDLPEALAVEMEGAALAQVCHDLGLPFAVLRSISDRADDSAHIDFLKFVQVVASRASATVVHHWLSAERQD
ncbi:MAG: hypothetical protein RIQ60_3111 [Pseudomonadota bacterium]|jgi:adenosylhomocysteine nucleosidase